MDWKRLERKSEEGLFLRGGGCGNNSDLWGTVMKVKLGDVCERSSSNIAQKDILNMEGEYPVYGAAGYIRNVDFYHQEKPYVAVVKDGAGIGRTMLLPEKSSVIGTLQYLLPKKNVLPEYLYYVVKNMHLEKYFTGATIPHIYFKDYQNEEFTLAKIGEQREIVATLKKIEKVIEYKMQEIELLETLIKARFVEMFGDPVNNEREWPTQTLDSVCKTIVDCPHSTPSYTIENTGYMCIRTSIVKKNCIQWDKIEYISESEYYQRIQRKRPVKGDIVYTREGAILGIAATIDRECNVALGQRSMLLSPNAAKCLPQFLSVAMNFDSFLKKALRGISGSASPHINVGDIKAFAIILPPLKLQNQFASFVAQTDKLKVVIQKSLDETQLLFDSLMQEYFG